MNKELTLKLVETTDNQGRPTYTLNGVDVCDDQAVRTQIQENAYMVAVSSAFGYIPDVRAEVLGEDDTGWRPKDDMSPWDWCGCYYRIVRPTPKPVSRRMTLTDAANLVGTLQVPVWLKYEDKKDDRRVMLTISTPGDLTTLSTIYSHWSTDPRGPWYPCEVIDGKIGGVVTPTEPKPIT